MVDARPSGKRYAAFISYGHEGNAEIAAAVETGLKRLAKPWNRLRALEVFRDQSSLPAGPALDAGLLGVLDRSSWLIYLASPGSAASDWVGYELRHWLTTRGSDRILVVVTGGEFRWDAAAGRLAGDAVHPELAAAFATEPLHVDLRWARDPGALTLADPRFRTDILNLAAPLHGVPKEDLDGDDTRQRQRTRRLARGAVAALATLTVAAVAASVLAVLNLREANRQRATAESRARTATSLRLAQLSRTSPGADGSLGFLLAARGYRFAPTPAAQGALIELTQADKAYRDEGLAHDLTSRIVGHAGGVSAIAVAPDGSSTASLDEAQTVRWVGEEPAPVTAVPVAGARDLTFADRDTLAVATDTGLVWLDVRDGRSPGGVAAARCADLASLGDGRVLCLAAGGEVSLVDRTGVRLSRPAPAGAGRLVRASTDGRVAVVQGWRGVAVLDLPTLTVRATWSVADEELAGVSPDGRSVVLLAANVADPVVGVRIADAGTGRTRWTVENDGRTMLPVAAGFLTNGTEVLVASENLEGRPARYRDGLPEGGTSLLRHLPPAPATVALMAISRDGQRVAVASRTGEVQTAMMPVKARVLDPVRPLSAAALGHTVLVRTAAGIGVADVRTGAITEVAAVDGGVLSPDGASVLGDDGRLWDVATRTVRAQGLPVPAADAVPAFSGDGRRMFYGTVDGRLVMLDVATARTAAVASPVSMFWTTEGRTEFVASLAASRDGSRLAVRTVEPDRAGKSGVVATLKVTADRLEPLATVGRAEPPSGVWADRPPLGFSADGRVVVYSGGVADLLDPETLRPTGTTLRGQADGHWFPAPDGTAFVASSCTTAVVDAATFLTLTPLPGPEMFEDVCTDVLEVAWTDHGRTLILRNDDIYETYTLDGDELVARACRLAGRDLTEAEWRQFIPEWPYQRTCAGAATEPPPPGSSAAPAITGPEVAAEGGNADAVNAVQRSTGVRLPMCAGRANPAGCWQVRQRFLDEAVVIRVAGGAPVAYYRVVRTGQWVVRDRAGAGPAGIPPAWAH